MKEEKRNPTVSDLGPDSQPRASEVEDLFRGLQPEIHRAKPSPDALAAALEAVQRMAAEMDAEQSVAGTSHELAEASSGMACGTCGYRNRKENKFCGMCGAEVNSSSEPGHNVLRKERQSRDSNPAARFGEDDPEYTSGPRAARSSAMEAHHYHHHYHHHYFPGGTEPTSAPSRSEAGRGEAPREFRSTVALRGDMSRAEAAVRSITQEWVLACNTKHLDDLLELYVSDALVLRSNCPPIRGAAAVREFFFGALEAGLGEVELEPLRIEVVGDFAYEGGRFKALIPGATGKRREERGKYLWVCTRQNAEWKLTADCWSSDLTLSNLESDIPASAAVKTAQPRKGV